MHPPKTYDSLSVADKETERERETTHVVTRRHRPKWVSGQETNENLSCPNRRLDCRSVFLSLLPFRRLWLNDDIPISSHTYATQKLFQSFVTDMDMNPHRRA